MCIRYLHGQYMQGTPIIALVGLHLKRTSLCFLGDHAKHFKEEKVMHYGCVT